MTLQALLGKKIEQSQRFLQDGVRIPVTKVQIAGNVVVSVKTKDKNGYDAVQIGFGIKKNPNKALQGTVKKAQLKEVPYFLREVKLSNGDATSLPSIGETLKALEIFKPGDIVDVIGISKGKGFAGVVKRHHFKGGPRTHGQSDRERAPGSIGQTTTPGRVYKGKRMAGRMGRERVTLQNLQVVDVSEDSLLIKGLVPGGRNSLLTITKAGEDKKFIPLFSVSEKLSASVVAREASDKKIATTETQKTNETQKPEKELEEVKENAKK